MNDSRLHILMADPHSQGGGQVRYVINLARELSRLGHQITLACRPGSLLAEQGREIGVTVLDTFTFRGGLRPGAWMHDLQAALRFIRNEAPDILHVSGSQDHWTFGVANRLLGHPACLVRTRHNTYSVKDNFPNRLLNRHWTDYEIVVCEVVRRTLSAQRAFDPARLCSIHNGVDAELFTAKPESRTKMRAEFGYTDEDIVIGIVARLTPAKGHTFLFKAAAQIKNQFPHLRILVLGQGELESALKEQVEHLGLTERVHFAGFRRDMDQCLQAVDIGVQPSIDCDTSSFSLKEMMALEIPVIASDYGGLKEIVSDGVEGMIVRTGTVEPLASALHRMLDSAEVRARMGRMGRHRVLADFTVEVFARRTEQAYRRAMGMCRQQYGRKG